MYATSTQIADSRSVLTACDPNAGSMFFGWPLLMYSYFTFSALKYQKPSPPRVSAVDAAPWEHILPTTAFPGEYYRPLSYRDRRRVGKVPMAGLLMLELVFLLSPHTLLTNALHYHKYTPQKARQLSGKILCPTPVNEALG